MQLVNMCFLGYLSQIVPFTYLICLLTAEPFCTTRFVRTCPLVCFSDLYQWLYLSMSNKFQFQSYPTGQFQSESCKVSNKPLSLELCSHQGIYHSLSMGAHVVKVQQSSTHPAMTRSHDFSQRLGPRFKWLSTRRLICSKLGKVKLPQHPPGICHSKKKKNLGSVVLEKSDSQ